MSKQQQLILGQFFEEILLSEIAQDKIKQQLSVNKGYYSQRLFNLISQNQKYITPKSLKNYFNNKIKVTENQLYNIFAKFDHELEGVIKINNFNKQINPLVKANRNERSNSNPQMLFLKLIQQIVDKQRLLNVCRNQLTGIVPYEVFDLIATQMKGFIGKNQLKVFLKINQIQIKQKDLDYLIHGLKRRSYFKITLEAFCQNIYPLEFGYYTKYKQSKQNEEQLEYKKKSKQEEDRIRDMKKHEQKIQNQARKQRRRQQAQNIKQRALQEQLKKQSQKARLQSQKLLRKAALEAQKLQRLEVQQQKLAYQDQLRQAEIQRIRLEQLKIISQYQLSQAQHLDRRIANNELDLSLANLSLRQQKAHLYEVQMANDIARQNIEVSLRRDRCLSDGYVIQRFNNLERDAQIQRISRQTALGLAQRQQQLQPYSYLQPTKTHIYRPNSSYLVNDNINLTPYTNSLNSTSKMRVSSQFKHSLMKEKPVSNNPAESKLRTPNEIRNQYLEKSRQQLDSRRKRLEDQIKTATGRKHPYV